jgi:hypothetical protein
MTRDRIKMLLNVAITASNTQVWTVTEEQLEKFAELVAATERERMKSEGWRQCAAGQRTTQYCDLLELAVANEREACAKLCEDGPIPKDSTTLTHIPTLVGCAAAIRARGNE